MKHLRTVLVLSALFPWTLTACNKSESGTTAEKAEDTENVPVCSRWIAGAKAREIIAEGGLLLDVRTPAEYEDGHLEGSKNIPVDELASRVDEIPHGQHVVVYCQSGKRAHRAATILHENDRQVSEIGHMGQYDEDAPAGCPD